MLTHRANAQKVETVSVTPQKDEFGNLSYKEFSDDIGLADLWVNGPWANRGHPSIERTIVGTGAQ